MILAVGVLTAIIEVHLAAFIVLAVTADLLLHARSRRLIIVVVLKQHHLIDCVTVALNLIGLVMR